MEPAAFFELIKSGETATVAQALVGHPELAIARDETGVSALMLAIYHRQPEIVAALRQAGDELDVFEAAALGELAELGELITEDPERVNAYSADGFTPLHFAAYMDHPEAIEDLLAAGARVDVVSRNGLAVTPLCSAAARANLVCARILLKAGADPNSQQQGGYTPVMSAAMQGDQALVELLLDHGADPVRTTEDGRSAADLARANGHAEVVELLV